MSARRGLRSSLVALAVAAMLASPVMAEVGFIPGAVTFKVDDTAKTITATANLAFYNRSCVAGSSCAADAAAVARIVQAIESMWNTGQKVKCYTFHVKVNARSVGSQSEAGRNEADIGLDSSPEVLRGYVAITAGQVHGDADSNPLGNTPGDRIDVAHNPDAPSTWPESTYDQVYAHEFGHILGLEDNYVKSDPKQLVSGASEDLMFRKQGVVTQEMVKRVIDRSGAVNLKDLKCGWHIKVAPPGGYSVTGVKCDDTDGEWSFTGKLVGDVQSTATYTLTVGAGGLTGNFQSSTISTTSVAVITINARGHGSIAIQADGSVLVTFDATTATSKAVAAGGEAVAQVPIPSQTFAWEANTGAECAISS